MRLALHLCLISHHMRRYLHDNDIAFLSTDTLQNMDSLNTL